MLDSFEISTTNQKKYSFNRLLEENLIFNYQNKSIFKEVELDEKVIMCYGYCFDVRSPDSRVEMTLTNLVKNTEGFYDNLKFLNGHYILIFKIDGKWRLVTDAVSVTPVYYSLESKQVTTKNDDISLSSLNGFVILNISNYSISRIDTTTDNLTNDNIEIRILDLVQNQYKYFGDKDITLNFRRNKMNKAIVSILKPILYNQSISRREEDDVTIKISKWLARDYKMELLSKEMKLESEYMCNTHLMNYKSFLASKSLDTEATEKRLTIEAKIEETLKYRKEEMKQLIYDPFNVVAIQEVLYGYYDEQNFDPLNRIISILNPTIDFYDFATGETLAQKYRNIKRNFIKKQKKEINDQFVKEAEENGITVSENLNGNILKDGIIVYPISQEISKNEIFGVKFNDKNSGMLLVESFFNNPRNANKIKVNVNGITYNIDEFIDGKFLNDENNFTLNFYYEKDYNAKSWQKAGRISIRKID